MKLENRISTKHQPIYDAAGLKGARIGTIGIGTEIIVDIERAEKDDLGRLFAPVLGPGDLGPIWKKSKKQGWIELANTSVQSVETAKYLLEIEKSSGKIIRMIRVS